MSRRTSLLGFFTVGALLSSACSIKTPDNGSTGSTAPDGESSTPQEVDTGEGGAAGSPGESVPAPNSDPCAACDSGHCLDDGTCVECVPKDDDCPQGQYCSDDNTCVPGCKDGKSCASGVCQDDHNCKSCINDRECADGFLCSAGECAAACSPDHEGESTGCGDGLTCCAARCSDLTTDSSNCGACGNSCDNGQFCGLASCDDPGKDGCVACHDLTLANVCSVSKVVVILDTNKNESDGNRVPGRAIGSALAEQCPPKPRMIEAEQDSVEALNLTTGRPVSNSSELLVVAGGPFYQNLEGYLEQQRIAPVYWKVGADSAEFRLSKGDRLIASLPIAGDHDSHDIFIIQFMRDAESGSLALNAQGFWLSGTVAAAYHLNQNLLPQLEKQDQAWYAFEWTDANGDKKPDSDEIQLLDSGS